MFLHANLTLSQYSSVLLKYYIGRRSKKKKGGFLM